jgi:hypothetical protein
VENTQIIVDPNLDWVEVRAECSPEHVFKELEQEVRADVVKMNTRAHGERFKVSTLARSFSVVDVVGGGDIKSVEFEVTKNGIFKITRSGKPSIEAALTLNNEGLCKLKIRPTEEELYRWQVRRLALEDLFFGAR